MKEEELEEEKLPKGLGVDVEVEVEVEEKIEDLERSGGLVKLG